MNVLCRLGSQSQTPGVREVRWWCKEEQRYQPGCQPRSCWTVRETPLLGTRGDRSPGQLKHVVVLDTHWCFAKGASLAPLTSVEV